MIEQRGMINHLYAKVNALGMCAQEVVAQTASQSFDISVWQMLAALVVGGLVEVFEDEVAHDPGEMVKQVSERAVTVMETVPSMLEALVGEMRGRQGE